MEFFDKIGKKATETYKGAAEKTGKIAKETKLKMAMNDNKSKINKLYKEIGKQVYQAHIDNKKVKIEDEIKETCLKIDVLADEIEDYRKEILELKDRKQCPKCNTEIDVEASYCPNCGEKQPERPQEDEDEAIEAEIVEDEEEEE